MTQPRTALASTLLLLVSCSTAGTGSTPSDPASIQAEAAAPSARELVARIARGAADEPLVGPHVLWSPLKCMAPPPPPALFSAASGEEGHARKLYVLRSNDPEAYLKLVEGEDEAREAPVGLTLIKQSFRPEPVAAAHVPAYDSTPAHDVTIDGYYPFVQRGGSTFRTGAPNGLFVMTKVAPGTPESEGGWIYGTVSPAGEVTSAGRVASCLECHRDAQPDNLFGVN